MKDPIFANRDLSWLSFNLRVLTEAANDEVPLMERIRFLAIYSSNLDEFYRVRMPLLMASGDTAARKEIEAQQEFYGRIITKQLIPLLENQRIRWCYGQPVPPVISAPVTELFFGTVMAYLNPVPVDDGISKFFAENNKLYQMVLLESKQGGEFAFLVNVPSDKIPRFYKFRTSDTEYILFLEDIIKHCLDRLFPGYLVKGAYNLKITRDAQLDLEEIPGEDIATVLERRLETRDLGFATRLLYEPDMSLRSLYSVVYALKLGEASLIAGGRYHNLRDLSSFPLEGAPHQYQPWPPVQAISVKERDTLFSCIKEKDILINVPYETYEPVLRFFNEAANDPEVTAVYVTLYRVASNSQIVTALETAARNGKDVWAMVELKARFDEANNLKWAKKMKAAGVKIIYSNIHLKVHAKIALVKRKSGASVQSLGLLATGNLNENTARFYTDHILLTANSLLLSELEQLFNFLAAGKYTADDTLSFRHLLISRFNLQEAFLNLIQREINHAMSGKSSGITIKLNNLEEQSLIAKLYAASQAGVRIRLIVRGICCLLPGVAGLSENITVIRIVGRYLEHGRIFAFHNCGKEEVWMGSADWMNRNIYNRIEVCFPVYDNQLRLAILQLLEMQYDNTAQEAIYQYLKQQHALPSAT
ncbi:polyphosphate kinase 1 [Pedobacter sp. JY14-1]|uniref:polyphosphate kinase 1 n=1 Tax=Pedobacter sp. JY14-1 TaxID=3034151 RepID=UPI0023E23639|nr:polyphosphate kinase 1 [Pedobacter sp. JY14-1]